MTWIVSRFRWIMLAAGALTLTMLYAVVAPEAALRSTFGEGLEGPIASIVVRNWGALIGLVGAMLLYGAYHVPSRPLILTIAGLSKLTFIVLVLSHGTRFFGFQAGAAVAIDSVMVLLFAAYLFSSRGRPLLRTSSPDRR